MEDNHWGGQGYRPEEKGMILPVYLLGLHMIVFPYTY
jgi:hypothetical protein